ncbi:hypothetical protein MKX03_034850 [Papaver bracteatum]|nr:hypothetical protein MKX03_034850 [Papaver bracteatum]
MSSQILKNPTAKFQWKLNDFSKLGADHYSDIFSVGDLKWRLKIYPKGNSSTNDHLSLFLFPVYKTKSPLYVELSLVVTSQTDSKNSIKLSDKHEFTEGSTNGFGWPGFMPLTKLHDHSKGYLLNNTCIIEVVITCLTSEVNT